jgi:hypothetical protein
MWVRPRSTVREIIQHSPSYGIHLITTILALENCFFYANLWSLRLNLELYTIIAIAAVASPILGYLWLFIMSRIFYLTGHLLRGVAPLEHLKVAAAWSKIPAIGILLSWIGIILIAPDEAFLEYGSGNPDVLIFEFLNIAFAIWSVMLTIRSIQEVEQFTFLRATANVLLAYSLFSLPVILLVSTTLFFLRY